MNALLSAFDNEDYEPSESEESDFEGGDITSYTFLSPASS